MKSCLECSISILSGSYCSLCAKAMISNNNVSMEAISMKTKSKLVIADLSLDSSKLYFRNSIAGTIGEEVQEETVGLFTETELEQSELEMLSKHTKGYLASAEDMEMKIDTAKAILKDNGYDFTGMVDELVIEIAQQFRDLGETGFVSTYKKDNRIKVTVQRKSTEGFWYTAKRTESNGEKTPISYFFEVEDLFETDDNGNIIDFKIVGQEGETSLARIMFDMGYREIHMQYVGEGKCLPLEQRFLVASQALRTVESLNGVELNQVLSPFFNKFDKESKEVVEEYVSWAYENLTDVGQNIVVLPCDNAESVEEALERIYSEGILTGTAVGSNYMAMADMEKEEVEENRRLEATIERDAKKERIVVSKKNAAVDARVETDLYKKTVALIKLSEVGDLVIFETATLEADLGIQKAAPAQKYEAKLKYFQEMMNNARLYKNLSAKEARKNGVVPGFNSRDYKELVTIINKYMSFTKIEAVIEAPSSILTNINALNSGSKKLSAFTDKELVEIYKAAVKHRAKHPEFNLKREIALAILPLTKAA